MAQKEIPIPIEDAVATLGVLDTQIKKWIEEDKPSLMQNHRGALLFHYRHTNSQITTNSNSFASLTGRHCVPPFN